jgi:uncharacterized DUF497 family protein
MPKILGFAFDEENEDKFAAHGLTVTSIQQVLDRPFAVAPNRKNRSAPYLVIGRNASGQCICIPVVETCDPEIWRPVTAWFCKKSEAARLPRE